MHGQLFNQLHPDWQQALKSHEQLISQIEDQITQVDISPAFERVFRSLGRAIDESRVVIFGQDPYPTPGNADGLAFSVSNQKLPVSLKNIFKELQSDIGGPMRHDSNLSDWFDQGVLLINRVMTIKSGSTMSHKNLGWQTITDAVAQELGIRGVVPILWGKPAQELSKYFEPWTVITSPHPSPLSAYKGFFGSAPFSQCNTILTKKGLAPINWQEKSPR